MKKMKGLIFSFIFFMVKICPVLNMSPKVTDTYIYTLIKDKTIRMNETEEQSGLQNSPLLGEEIQEEAFRYGFRIAELGFLIPEGIHSTLIDNAIVYPVPNTINWLKGLANVRGNMVPVFDLGAMLEVGIKPEKNMIMVMILGKRSVAFGVDSGQSIKESALSIVNTSMASELQEYTHMIYQEHQVRWLEFDFVKCLSQYENQIAV